MDNEKLYLNRTRGELGSFKRVKARKKICPNCGKLLWRKDFYATHKGRGVTSLCKECYKEKRRTEHIRKHEDGFFHDEIGRPIEYVNGHRKFDWTPQMISDLKRFYPITKNDELAGMFMMSKTTVARKARSLGIVKDKEWFTKVAKENALLGGYANKRRIVKQKDLVKT